MEEGGGGATAPAAVPPKEPSFRGRLRLKDFMFVPKSGAAITPSRRRSPRLGASPSGAPSPRPSPSSTSSQASPSKVIPRSRKRKAEESEFFTTTTTTTTATTAIAAPGRGREEKKARRSGGGGGGGGGYAPPSAYAHLPQTLPDAVAPGLLVLFVGLNPGVATARAGHAYAHPTNLFWRLLHRGGLTPGVCAAADDAALPARHALGLTNIVARPSRSGAELAPRELDAGVAALGAKCARWRPEVACLVGKGIWDSVSRVRRYDDGRDGDGDGEAKAKGKGKAVAFAYGWQPDHVRMGVVEDDDAESEGGRGRWPGARVFVASSTSGLAATLRPEEKERIWKELGDWCIRRRKERAEEEEGEKLRAAAAAAAGSSSSSSSSSHGM